MATPDITFFVADLLKKGVAEHVFPGAVAGISIGPPENRRQLCVANGHLQYDAPSAPMAATTLFDLASLTKPLATLTAILCLKKSKRIDFTTSLSSFFGTIPEHLREITVEQILCHCAGFIAHRPFYLELRALPQKQRKARFLELLLRESPAYPPGSQSIYSDLGFMILTWVVEKISGLNFDEFLSKQVFTPLNLADHLFFNTSKTLHPGQYAPTEKCPWQGRILSGTVHDDNCAALGGVCGHAGLFGDIHGVLTLTTLFLDIWHNRSAHPNFENQDLKMATRKKGIPGSTWGLGFDTPSATKSSAGNLISKQSFGHLGFTGTSFWIDPENELVVVLLSNRVHPKRTNNKIRPFRSLFHNAIWKKVLPKNHTRLL